MLLAPRTLAALHAGVGSQVRLAGNRASEVLTVTGSGLVPEGSHNSYADGGWLAPAGYSGLFTGFKYHIVLVRTGPGVPAARARQTVHAQLTRVAPRLASADLEPAQSPMEMAELGQVQVLPVVLGVFRALLAIGAVGHALVTVVQRRIQDVAILRVMGMKPRECRLIVLTQGLVLALAGLLIGLPVGLVVGRLLWRTVAGYTPVQYVPPIATVVMVVIVPAAGADQPARGVARSASGPLAGGQCPARGVAISAHYRAARHGSEFARRPGSATVLNAHPPGRIRSVGSAPACGRGSVGRASPCQGEGRGFESRRPLGGAGFRPAGQGPHGTSDVQSHDSPRERWRWRSGRVA